MMGAFTGVHARHKNSMRVRRWGSVPEHEENSARSERSARASVCYALELDQPVLVM